MYVERNTLSSIVRSLIVCLLLPAALPAAHGLDSVWIEGEALTGANRLKQVAGVEKRKDKGKGYTCSGWGNLNVFAAGKMLHTMLSPAEVDKFLPEEGLIFSYDFTVKTAGRQHVWARIGWEFVRSDFDWRIDQGEWLTCSHMSPTTNVQPIQTWNELGWIELGSPELTSGRHVLQFRLIRRRVKDKKGRAKTQRILFGLDCVCITPGEFQPDGKWRPGSDHRTGLDREAEKNVFKVNAGSNDAGRTRTVLNGLWTTAAWDERPLVDEKNRLGPVRKLPDLHKLRWYAYKAPGDRNRQHPEMSFSHRYLLRTRLDVPATLKGRGFFLDVQRSNMIISVFLNGRFAGWTKTFLTAWRMDLTPYMIPGRMNELVFVIKDVYYSVNPKGDRRGLNNNRAAWNYPLSHMTGNQSVCARMDLPVAGDVRTGILEPAALVVCGPVYTDDAFVKPSVRNKNLGLELTLRNPGIKPVKVEVVNRVVPWNHGRGGKVECLFAPVTAEIPAGGSVNLDLRQAWSKPHIWWPDDPFLYWVITELRVNSKIMDIRRTRFGFREWDWSTHMFKLNGIKWPMWADLSVHNQDPRKQVKVAAESHQNHTRLWTNHGLGGMTRREVLDYFDETGMLVRSSGIFDGQRCNYGAGLVETDPDGKPDKRGRKPRRAKLHFFANWYDHLADWIREERNHPCVYIWSLENEITYINVNNYGLYREVEPAIRRGAEIAMKTDPTRPVMVDGGNCLRDESLPVNGAHYTEFMNGDFRDMPDLAYTRQQYYDKKRPQRGAWRMVPNRPIMAGEVYFANGYSNDRFATIGGDRCFIGRGQTRHARGLFAKVLSEGYRWAEVASWQFWMGSEAEHFYWNSWSPVAVLCRQWNWTFGARTRVERTLRIFNSTRFGEPVTVAWELRVGGNRIAGRSETFAVAPGESRERKISFTTPPVTSRTRGEFILTATRDRKEVFREVKPMYVIAPERIPRPRISRDEFAVFDPKGMIKAYLRKRGIGFHEVTDPAGIPKSATFILVGTDAISRRKATDTTWLTLAAAGKKVLVLDQEFPLYYQAIPADLKPTRFTGRIGFSQDLTHPVFAGLEQPDFFCWGNDHVLYRNAYRKGTRGGRSLLHCDNSLGYTALMECRVNDGLLMLSQLAIGGKLANTGIAQAVFNNLLNYAAGYRPVRKQTCVVLARDGAEERLLKRLGLRYTHAQSPLAALDKGQVVVVEANRTNLKMLADGKGRVDAFCKGGGWLMLWGLTPDGLDAYNRLVEEKHFIRRFAQERVTLRYPLDSLAAGLTLRDVVMDTGEKIFRWMAVKKPDQDGFSYVVNHQDIAPFCRFPTPMEMGKPSNDKPGIDHWPRNLVNGFTRDDAWIFTFTMILERGDKRRITLTLPRAEKLATLKIRPGANYDRVTELRIFFDQDPKPLIAPIPVRDNPGIEEIALGGRSAHRLTIEVSKWQDTSPRKIVVLDNLWLMVERSPEYLSRVKSLLNIGVLMRYNRGKGGILLNQVKLLEHEKNPVNARKKANIVKTLLANMGAVFGGDRRMVIAGSGLEYRPVKIAEQKFNAYVSDAGKPGWFRNGRDGDMRALPVGDQTFANTDYHLLDFNTSPVPSVMLLGCRASRGIRSQAITGIDVNRRADASTPVVPYRVCPVQ